MEHFSRKYLEAFPFSMFYCSRNLNEFFYLYEIDGKKLLHFFDRKRHETLEDGELVVDIDFNKQSYRPLNIIKNHFYIMSDVDNEENYNIFRIDLSKKTIQQITEYEYTACCLVDDNEIAYYTSRKTDEQGLFQSEIYIHNLRTNKNKTVGNDCGETYRIGWGRVIPSKNEKYLVVNVDKNNERTNENFSLLNIETGEKRLLLPKEYESSTLYLIDNVVDTDKGFYFVSDCSKYEDLYYYSFKSREILKLTNTNFITKGFDYLKTEEGCYFYQVKLFPQEGKSSILTFKEEADGVISKVEEEVTLDGEISVFSSNLDFVWISESHLTKTPSMSSYCFKNLNWKKIFEVSFVRSLNEELIHSTSEYITYQSFDGLEISGYVVIPKGEIKGAIITAFYGGYNYFSSSYQIMAELGFISLSPAVRGSWGHGKEWEDKIKGDLGGGEILDILWGARFLEEKFNLDPRQIGIVGGSHGGYATLRALTLPKNFKGVDSKYNFGFGICWAGFADLVDFYKTSNIPDWLSNMLGPFETNEELYMNRSPLNFFDELSAPLFITHGTKDSRVPPSTMNGFLEKLRGSNKAHYIYLMDGQGHTGGSIDERVEEYKTMFKFLEETTGLGWTK